jgi:hypothetical protein
MAAPFCCVGAESVDEEVEGTVVAVAILASALNRCSREVLTVSWACAKASSGGKRLDFADFARLEA